ncbi:hypothetical protein ABI59_13775 [Acidobacteria bacterium Mor1]|nr:hypothetical protein ABI59_13775 [Acidobacteria bacterium Mor1]
MLRPRTLLWILLAVIAVGALAYGFMFKQVDAAVSHAERGDFRVTIREEGRTRLKDRFVIDAPVQAETRRIELEVGDRVEEGQALVTLVPTASTPLDPRSRAEARERVSAAEASLTAARERIEAARAESDYAEARDRRMERLFGSGEVSREQRDQAEAEQRRTAASLRSAEFSAKVAEHELAQARAALRSVTQGSRGGETMTLKSPVAGAVLRVHHESAGVVRASEPLIEIGDPLALEVEVDVLSHHAVQIGQGMRVEFERWGGDRPLEGQVRVVEPVGFTKISALGVEEQRVWVISDFTDDAEDWRRLGDGYRVEAVFIVWEGEDILQVPTSALFRQGDDWAVFAVEGGRAEIRVVEIGRRSGLATEIVSGLEPGETVLSHPTDQIEEGVRIRERD